ncbi:hypothetical protein C8J56DRAFT_813361 [Mycena floridula]|nr:hypothetical protein C8J56DRAFT_813361 [Mycena floridula]
MPTGPEAYRRLKHLCPVFDHKLGDKWDYVGPKIRDILDKQQVRFSTIDVVRFRTVPDQQTSAFTSPVVIWIGVLPDSLAGKDAFNSANLILALLDKEGITDVDIEFRESVFRPSAGAKLYKPALDTHPTRYVIDPLTTALGLSIAAAKTPYIQGTMGFYFKDGDELYGVTARHVLFPGDEDNSDYTYHPSSPRKQVLLMGTKTWAAYLQSLDRHINTLVDAAEFYENSIERSEEEAVDDTDSSEEEDAAMDLEDKRVLLKRTNHAINKLLKLHDKTKKDFGKPSQRIIGHVVWSPAITAGPFTKDICIIKLDKARFLPNFRGNVIDLGTEIRMGTFTERMNSHIDKQPAERLPGEILTKYPKPDKQHRFRYPVGRLLKLRNILTEHQMRHPDTKDHNNEACLYVIKRGLTTLTTIGHPNGFFSYVRQYFSNQTHQDSKEWAILPYDNDSGPFSKGGDSGSIIASGAGEIGGLLTGGCGITDPSDITYATPMFWLWPIIKEEFPNADLYPVFN